MEWIVVLLHRVKKCSHSTSLYSGNQQEICTHKLETLLLKYSCEYEIFTQNQVQHVYLDINKPQKCQHLSEGLQVESDTFDRLLNACFPQRLQCWLILFRQKNSILYSFYIWHFTLKRVILIEIIIPHRTRGYSHDWGTEISMAGTDSTCYG